MFKRFICAIWGHREANAWTTKTHGRHHIIIFQCPRCTTFYQRDYYDPR